MPSLLVVVFVIQLVVHTINTIGAKTINEMLWQSYIRLPFVPVHKAFNEQVRLRRDVVQLKREMNAISAQDEFSRWAKIRRQHDKALEAHDRQATAVSSSKSSFETKATMIRWVSTTGLRFAIQFWHSKTPVFTYPQGWVPWYVEWALGFPRCPRGGVSINIWSAACATAIALIGDIVTLLATSIPNVQSEQKIPPLKVATEKKSI